MALRLTSQSPRAICCCRARQLAVGNSAKSTNNKSGQGSGKTDTPKANSTDKDGNQASVTVAAAVTVDIVTTVSLAQVAGGGDPPEAAAEDQNAFLQGGSVH